MYSKPVVYVFLTQNYKPSGQTPDQSDHNTKPMAYKYPMTQALASTHRASNHGYLCTLHQGIKIQVL